MASSSSSSSSSALSEMQKAMDNILALHGKDLHTKIHAFPAKAQKAFYDQVTRRFVPQPNDVASYIEQEGVQMRNKYLNIVHELLFENPYNGFYPTIKVQYSSQVQIYDFLQDSRIYLTHAHMDVVVAHVYEALIRFPDLQSQRVGNLLQIIGGVQYLYEGAYYLVSLSIHLSDSYPEDPPEVWVVCQKDSAINIDHMYVAASGIVSIPYQGDWDGQSSSLVQLILHLCVEFTSQPPTFIIDVGILLSDNQMELLKIILDYRISHLYYEIKKITPQATHAFFSEVAARYPQGLPDLPGHIRSSRGGVKKFIENVADILGQLSKTRSTVDVAFHDFLP